MRLLSLCITAAALLIAGCSKEVEEQTTASEPVLSLLYRHESVTVIVSVNETNITTSGKIRLMLDVHARPNEEVVFPEIENTVAPFTVADRYAEPVHVLPNSKHLHRWIWTLVPNLPGETAFPALEFSVGTITIKTAPIVVQVCSLLPENAALFEIKDIARPAALLPEEKQKQQRRVILLGAMVAMTFMVIGIKLGRRPKKIVTLTPHETAFLALGNLPKEELAKIQVLSEILLAFIDDRLKLQTAGKTIAEIIPYLPKDVLFGRRFRLEEILASSEHIRFSNKVPPGFANELEDYVRSFLEGMKEVPCD